MPSETNSAASGSIIIRDGAMLDPQHDVNYQPANVHVINGIIEEESSTSSPNVKNVDVGGRIIIPGGIYPSFRLPIPFTNPCLPSVQSVATSLVSTGFTTIICEGISPFTSLDTHAVLQRIPCVNKMSLLDLANFPPALGYLKNGITNYATELVLFLLREFKGLGITCFEPGSTTSWYSREKSPRSLDEEMPFVGCSKEKIIREAVQVAGRMHARILVETGTEGKPGNLAAITALASSLEPASSGGKGSAAFKQLARLVLNGNDASPALDEIEKRAVDLLAAPDIAGFVDLPDLFGNGTLVGNQSLNGTMISPGTRSMNAEGELLVQSRINHPCPDDEQAWLTGLELLATSRRELEPLVAFSMSPGVPGNAVAVARTIAALLDASTREHLLHGHEPIHGHDTTLAFEDYIFASRVVPADIMGLSNMIGGLSPGQVGDIVVLDARENDLPGILANEKESIALLSQPYMVVKQGEIAFKNDRVDHGVRGFTFVQGSKADPSIGPAVQQNVDKQFMKYYSTHLDSKLVPHGLVFPVMHVDKSTE